MYSSGGGPSKDSDALSIVRQIVYIKVIEAKPTSTPSKSGNNMAKATH